MPLILPIEQWRNGDVLVDPTGLSYDPNSPPAIIAGDEVLGSAIAFVRENPRKIGVAVLSGLQTVAADLGAPGAFEGFMSEADLYGSSSFGLPTQLDTQGYAKRVEDAIMNHGRPTLSPFNTMQWDGMDATDSTTYSNLAAIRAAIDNSVEGFETMQSLDMASLGLEEAPEEVGVNAFVGEVHLTNHLNWLAVANACDRVRRLRRNDRVQVLIDEGVTGFSLVRSFDTLGVRTELHEMGRDAWPPEVIDEVLDIGSTITTGRIPD